MSGTPSPLLGKFKVAGNLVFTSGVVSATGDIDAQIRGCFEKLKGILAEAGLTLGDVLKVNVYLADIADRDGHLNPIWREMFPKAPPARTTVQSGLGAALVEMDVVAAKS